MRPITLKIIGYFVAGSNCRLIDTLCSIDTNAIAFDKIRVNNNNICNEKRHGTAWLYRDNI